MNKIIFIVSITLILSGCSLFKEKPRDINFVDAPSANICNDPPKADKIVTRNIDFKIIKDEFGIYWISLSPRYYENLSVNMQEIMQHIKQKNAIIKYYKSCHADNSNKDTEKSDNSPPK